MTGNLESLIRWKVTFLCPVTWCNYCLTNGHLGQGKLLLLLAQGKRWWRGRVCHLCASLCARAASSSFSCHADESRTSHPLSCAGWQSGRRHLALFQLICLIPSFGRSLGAGWPQCFKALREYSLPTAWCCWVLKPSLQITALLLVKRWASDHWARLMLACVSVWRQLSVLCLHWDVHCRRSGRVSWHVK